MKIKQGLIIDLYILDKLSALAYIKRILSNTILC